MDMPRDKDGCATMTCREWVINKADVTAVYLTPDRAGTNHLPGQAGCNNPTSAWRPFLPVRASASTSPAIALRLSASSSSR